METRRIAHIAQIEERQQRDHHAPGEIQRAGGDPLGDLIDDEDRARPCDSRCARRGSCLHRPPAPIAQVSILGDLGQMAPAAAAFVEIGARHQGSRRRPFRLHHHGAVMKISARSTPSSSAASSGDSDRPTRVLEAASPASWRGATARSPRSRGGEARAPGSSGRPAARPPRRPAAPAIRACARSSSG